MSFNPKQWSVPKIKAVEILLSEEDVDWDDLLWRVSKVVRPDLAIYKAEKKRLNDVRYSREVRGQNSSTKRRTPLSIAEQIRKGSRAVAWDVLHSLEWSGRLVRSGAHVSLVGERADWEEALRVSKNHQGIS
jgi:hypothetical protein